MLLNKNQPLRKFIRYCTFPGSSLATSLFQSHYCLSYVAIIVNIEHIFCPPSVDVLVGFSARCFVPVTRTHAALWLKSWGQEVTIFRLTTANLL